MNRQQYDVTRAAVDRALQTQRMALRATGECRLRLLLEVEETLLELASGLSRCAPVVVVPDGWEHV